MSQGMIEAPREQTVHDVVRGVATRIADRGPDGADANEIELHLVIDHQRADAARTIADALHAELKGTDQVGKRIKTVLSSFLEAEADYGEPLK